MPIVPATADTTYTFQGTILHENLGHTGFIPECGCFGNIFDGPEVGSISGKVTFDDGDGHMKLWWFSFNGNTIRSDDPVFTGCCVLNISRQNGAIDGWNIAMSKTYRDTNQSVIGDDALSIYSCSSCNAAGGLESAVDGDGSGSRVFGGSSSHGTWRNIGSDSDRDDIYDDGDSSGTAGDHPCTGGNTVGCDDNCPNVANPGQEDSNGNGIGDACDSCGSNGDPCVQSRIDPILGCVMDDGRDFNPDFWSDGRDTELSNNCYSYATNKYTPSGGRFSMPQPGTGAGLPALTQDETTCQGVTTRAIADGLSIINCDSNCSSNSRKIALVVDPGVDYHWYREHGDGTWSHKPGSGLVKNFDASGQTISDPRTANRDYSFTPSGLNYRLFCECFCTSINCDETIE